MKPGKTGSRAQRQIAIAKEDIDTINLTHANEIRMPQRYFQEHLYALQSRRYGVVQHHQVAGKAQGQAELKQ